MASMKSLMLGAAILAGAVGLGTTNAKAAQFGVFIGGQSAYAAPYPGPGYAWVAGYYDGGYWIPGRWAYTGRFDGDDFYRGHDRDRYYDRERNNDRWRAYDHDRDRGHDRFRR
jgi:hypothetical protein